MLSACLAISMHLLPGDWNSVHPCIRYENRGFVAGAYLNSEYSVSAFGGGVWRRDDLWAEAGVVTGYQNATALPFVRFGVERDNIRYFVAPAFAGKDFGVVLGVEIFTGKEN